MLFANLTTRKNIYLRSGPTHECDCVRQAFSTRFVEAPIANYHGARCASSSVASCFSMEGRGGGGARPPNVPIEKRFTTSPQVTYARVSEASECLWKCLSHLHTYNQCSSLLLIMVWRYKRKYTNTTLTLRKSMNMRASGACELGNFSHFHIQKLLILSTFCWYFTLFTTSDALPPPIMLLFVLFLCLYNNNAAICR